MGYPDGEGAAAFSHFQGLMRTTLKRGIGRGAAVNGNGRVVLPPVVTPTMTVYRQPLPPRRGTLALFGRALLWLALAAAVVGTGLAGGAYLYVDESVVGKVRAHTKELRAAAKELDIVPAGEPATALVIGYDKRAFGAERQLVPRSDTIMLVRADPRQQALSMLSLPRDLYTELRCPGRPSTYGRINGAFSECGTRGVLATVRGLTGLPVNYLITVNFRGFQQLVARVGGVWLDVDRRYFNDNSDGGEQYSEIDLQPGYQKLDGADALSFVRYRHADSDIYRLARQQLFVGAFREAVTSSFSPRNIPRVVRTVTSNVEVGVAGDRALDKQTLWRYALFAYQLPAGHLFQTKLEGLTENSIFDLTVPEENLRAAVQEFASPDVEAPLKATNVALGRKPKPTAGPPPRETSVVVLNGNGVPGAAANGSALLAKRGYLTLSPPGGAAADAPSFGYFRSKAYFDRSQPQARPAARTLARLVGSADVEPMPGAIARRSSGALVVVVVGRTFDGTLAPVPIDKTPPRGKAEVRQDAEPASVLLRSVRRRARFPLQVPAVIEKTSSLDPEMPMRVYAVAGHRAVRLVYRTGASEYWGVQMTSWRDAPILAGPNTVVRAKGRRYELHYSGPKLHMVVLRERGATYWVVNTLLNSLSNETMLAIAKGLRPLGR